MISEDKNQPGMEEAVMPGYDGRGNVSLLVDAEVEFGRYNSAGNATTQPLENRSYTIQRPAG